MLRINFRESRFRFLGLLFICLSQYLHFSSKFSLIFRLGNYFSYDIPSAIETPIQEDTGATAFLFTALYSINSLPNMVTPLYGGYLVDRVGVRFCIVSFTLVLVLGQYICSLGAYFGNIWVLLFGRFVFGLTNESMVVTTSAMVSLWFDGKELAFALGSIELLGRLGSSFNQFITPKIYVFSGNLLVAPFFFGLLLTIFSFFAALVASYLDWSTDKLEALEKTPTTIKKQESRPFNFSDLRKLSFPYWLMVLLFFIFTPSFYTWTEIWNTFYIDKYHWSNSSAGSLLTIPYAIGALLTAIIGFLVDLFGHKGKFLITAFAIGILVHLFWLFLPSCDQCWESIIPLVVDGFFFAFFSALIFPAMSVFVGQEMRGIAFGISLSFVNLAMFIFGPFFGFVIDLSGSNPVKGYSHVSLMLIFITVLGITTAGYLEFRWGKELSKVLWKREKLNGLLKKGKSIDLKN